MIIVKYDQEKKEKQKIYQKNSQFVSTCSSDGNSNFKKVRSSFESFASCFLSRKEDKMLTIKSHTSSTRDFSFILKYNIKQTRQISA